MSIIKKEKRLESVLGGSNNCQETWIQKKYIKRNKTKTKINQQTIIKNDKNKSNEKIQYLSCTTITEIDRCEVPNLNVICNANPGNE